MAGFVAGGGAGGAVGEGEGVFGGHQEGFAVDAGEADVEDVGEAALGVAVDVVVDGLEVGEEFLAGGEGGGAAGGPFEAGQPGGFAEADCERDGDGAGAEAAFLAAAEEEGLNGTLGYAATADDEGSDALGAVDFVAADRDQVGVE